MPVREPRVRKGLLVTLGHRAYRVQRATPESRVPLAHKENQERWVRRATLVRQERTALLEHRVLQVNVDPLAHKAKTVLDWLALQAQKVTQANRGRRGHPVKLLLRAHQGLPVLLGQRATLESKAHRVRHS